MEINSFTSGPWRIGDAGTTIFGPPNGNPSPEIIAYGLRTKANARLIAASPKLYEAAKDFIAYLEQYWPDEPLFGPEENAAEDLNTLRAAIAEATISEAGTAS